MSVTLPFLEKQEAELKAKLENIQRYIQAEKNKANPLHPVATALHEVFCTANHADGCGWYYDRGDWSEYSRVAYLQKANVLHGLCCGDMEEVELFITRLKAVEKAS